MTEKWTALAKEIGFSDAAAMDLATLRPLEMVRDMCAADKCRAYGKNWTCPPACGTLEECRRRMAEYRYGVLVQTVGRLDRAIDTRGYARTEARHRELFEKFAAAVRADYPNALCLEAGACRVCEACAYPEPCRFPERAFSSMEAYGLFVTQVCKDNGIIYYHGERTIAYFACVLYG